MYTLLTPIVFLGLLLLGLLLQGWGCAARRRGSALLGAACIGALALYDADLSLLFGQLAVGYLVWRWRFAA